MLVPPEKAQQAILGSTWIFRTQCVDPITGLPQDLTGGAVQLRIADLTTVNPTDLCVDLTIMDADTPIIGGMASFDIQPEQQIDATTSAILSLGQYRYELRSIDYNGIITTQEVGLLTVYSSLFSEFPYVSTTFIPNAFGQLDGSNPSNSALMGH